VCCYFCTLEFVNFFWIGLLLFALRFVFFFIFPLLRVDILLVVVVVLPLFAHLL
jgi:hypothetical protein